MSETVCLAELQGPEDKKLTTKLPAKIHAELKVLAAGSGKTMKELVIESFHQYLKPKYGQKEN